MSIFTTNNRSLLGAAKISMKIINENSTKSPKGISKKDVNMHLLKLDKKLYSLQNLFYAEKKHALLIILHGMDTSGKDGTIRHVYTCVNPQGCKVKSFKGPTEEELSHDFLWRIHQNVPETGMMQIFNRSHYEDILYPVVHKMIGKAGIEERHEAINNFEEHLQKSGTIILKFYLHISERE